jgi:hypothetical protein
LLDEGSVLLGCTQIVPETRLTLTEGVEESPIPLGSTQFVPEAILTLTEAINLPSLELAQTVLVGSSILPEHSGLVDVSEGFESSATVLPVPEAQLLVNGLTEAQAWYLGWLRDGIWSHELLDVIEGFEVQNVEEERGWSSSGLFYGAPEVEGNA